MTRTDTAAASQTQPRDECMKCDRCLSVDSCRVLLSQVKPAPEALSIMRGPTDDGTGNGIFTATQRPLRLRNP